MDDQGNSTAAGDVRRKAHDVLAAWPRARARAHAGRERRARCVAMVIENVLSNARRRD